MAGELAAVGAWARALHDEWGVRHLGVVTCDIPIPVEAERSGDPYDLLYAVFEFAEWATDEAQFLECELPDAAVGSWLTEKFVASSGGLGDCRTYLGNHGWNKITHRYIDAALLEMSCDAHRGFLSEIDSFISADERRACLAVNDPYARVPGVPETNTLGPVEEQVAKQAAWLRSSAPLLPLPASKLLAARRTLASQNKLRSLRREETVQDLPGNERHTAFEILRMLDDKQHDSSTTVFFQGFACGLSRYFPGEYPRPAFMWRFMSGREILDVLLIPALTPKAAEAVLFSSNTVGPKARMELDSLVFKRAMFGARRS